MILSREPKIVHGSHLLVISDENVLTLLELGLPLKIGLDKFASLIGGCIIDDNNMVIVVILHGDGFDVLEVSSSISVVEGGQDNAEGKFFVFVDIVLGLVIFPLFL